MKILIFDDEASHRLLEKRALKRVFPQAHFFEASTHDEARATLSSSADIQLLIIDLNIAGISALNLVQELRLYSSIGSLPIVLISTSQLALDIERAYAAGVNCYVFKSEDPSEFSNNISGAARFVTRPSANKPDENS